MSPSLPIEPASFDGFGLLSEASGSELDRQNGEHVTDDRAETADPTPASAERIDRRPVPDQVPAVLDLITRVLMAPDASTARHFAAHLIADHFKADFVVIGQSTKGSNPCEASVISGSTPPGMERRDEMEAALGETLATGREHLIAPPATTPLTCTLQASGLQSTLASLAHRQLAEALGGKRCLISVPLINTSDQAVGVVLVVWTMEPGVEAAFDCQWRADFLHHAAAPLSDCFSIFDQAQPTRLENWIEKATQPVRSKTRVWLGIACASLLLLGIYPVRYPVRADVTLQPQTRRFIASPVDAPLAKAHVHPGQRVQKGDLLVTLDAEQTHSRLTALQAEAEGALSERSGFFASGRIGDAELARLKAARLEGEIEQLQQHLRRMEVRSPLDGVILGDDLTLLEGASLKTGQMLCEVAPLDRLVAELEIPPDQIVYIAKGQHAAIRLEATGRLKDLPITRVHPRAEPNASGEYHFNARVEIANETNDLKPGMRGVAAIKTERRPLAWCVFHRLWQRIRTWS